MKESAHRGRRAAGATGRSIRLVRAPGTRAAEAQLLEEIGARSAALRTAPEDLARFIYLVVPSNSLRLHLGARLVREHGAQAGVRIVTLRMLAHELLRRGKRRVRDGSALLPILARRLASEMPVLHSTLSEMQDGYGAILAPLNDLLDAGFDPEQHLQPLLDAIAKRNLGRAGERASAVVHVAAALQREFGERGLLGRAGLFREALAAFKAQPDLLPGRGLWVYGYADITGTQGDLLCALLEATRGCIILNAPPDPADPSRIDAGAAFLTRLQNRVLQLADVEVQDRTGDEALRSKDAPAEGPSRRELLPAEPTLLQAPGIQAEVRETAERIARMLEEEPELADEEIGVVVRDLALYLDALRAQFDRVGVAYSGAPGRAVIAGPGIRPVQALLDLLDSRNPPSVDRWLDAEAELAPGLSGDLRLAFHAMGKRTLEQVADIKVSPRGYPLPVRRGVDEQEGEGGSRAPRRRLAADDLERACGSVRAALEVLGERPGRAPLAEHLAWLNNFVVRALGWRKEDESKRAFDAKLRALLEELEGGNVLAGEEFLVLLGRGLRSLGFEPLGADHGRGAGGGVRVLSAIEARGHSFRRLFVLGMNRGVFPRGIGEDPLLPDLLRTQLESVLPDIPIKRRSHDEERHLFAELCSSSPDLTLSYTWVSDDGKEQTPSPFIERLRLVRGQEEIPRTPEWMHERARPLPPDELLALLGASAKPQHRVLLFEAALAAGHDDLVRASPARRADAPPAASSGSSDSSSSADSAACPRPPSPGAWAAGRVAAALAVGGGLRGRELGAHFGLFGAGAVPSAAPPVSHLEQIARCPWRAFLQRELRLAPLPDTPLELPTLSPLLIGNLVHRVLERVVQEVGGRSAERIDINAPPHDIPLPGPGALETMLLEVAKELLEEEGISIPGFAYMLARLGADMVMQVLDEDFRGGVLTGVLGAELHGELEVDVAPGERFSMTFRADRVDRVPGGLLLTDYKTGKPVFGETKKQETRNRKFLDGIRQGSWLQAAAYAESAAPFAHGRYLFVGPKLESAVQISTEHLEAEETRKSREKEAGEGRKAKGRKAAEDRKSGGGFREVFRESAAHLARIRKQGAFVPRLVNAEGDVYEACARCDLQSACNQGDVGARRRLHDWLERRAALLAEKDPERAQPIDPVELALLRVMRPGDGDA